MSDAGGTEDDTRSETDTDKDVRALLAKIAARAGDPPEHGLEDVAALRRRRARHRRGAVATAVVLAVAGVAAAPWVMGLGDDSDDVTSVADAGSTPRPAELPDVVELRCAPGGIDVPVATIRPQSDGLHLAVDNQLRGVTEVWVTSDGWDSGPIPVEPGRTDLHQPVPPGMLTVGCRIGDRDEQRQVDLVDVERVYEAPELACPAGERRRLSDLPVDPPNWSLATATRQALADYIHEDDDVRAPGGYPDESLGTYHTTDPTVRVVRDGETVAFVHVAAGGAEADADAGDQTSDPDATNQTGATDGTGGTGGTDGADDEAPTGSTVELWSRVRLVEACASFLDQAAEGTDRSVAESLGTSAN
jgi:hypothetical protein